MFCPVGWTALLGRLPAAKSNLGWIRTLDSRGMRSVGLRLCVPAWCRGVLRPPKSDIFSPGFHARLSVFAYLCPPGSDWLPSDAWFFRRWSWCRRLAAPVISDSSACGDVCLHCAGFACRRSGRRRLVALRRFPGMYVSMASASLLALVPLMGWGGGRL
jgi:hypothetical protein